MNTEIKFRVTAAENSSFHLRVSATGQALSPEAAARALFAQLGTAPDEVFQFLATNQPGTPADLWKHLATKVRAQTRHDLAPDLALADAVRAVVANPKRG